MLGISVLEIHRYPSRPEGFEEPFFSTTASRRTIGEHLLQAPWLVRASELKRGTGEAAHVAKEPIQVKNFGDQVELVPPHTRQRCSWKRRRVIKVLDRWREVREWWDEDGSVDRMVFRVLLAEGAVVEVAREHLGDWLLVGVVD